MWYQPLDPLNNLPLSSLVASAPIILLLSLLTAAKLPGYLAASLSSLAALILAHSVWGMPLRLALLSYLYGTLFGLWPISWIVLNAVLFFKLSEEADCLNSLEAWLTSNVPRDPSLQAILIAFLFSGFVEGLDGYGFPIVVSATLLTRLGFEPFKAITVSLLANTITVPFASLGVPLLTLSSVSGLSFKGVSLVASLQLLAFSLAIPLCMLTALGRDRVGLNEGTGIALLSGLSLGSLIVAVTAYLSPALAGVLSPLAVMAVTVLYFKLSRGGGVRGTDAFKGWMPWVYLIALISIASSFKLSKLVRYRLEMPYLHRGIYVSSRGEALSAIYCWEPLSQGTITLLATLLILKTFNLRLSDLKRAFVNSLTQLKFAIPTIVQMMGLAFLMNYSGMNYTLGSALALTDGYFPFLSAFIGWLGTFVSGSSTGSNALFGNLQRVAAEALNLPPYVTVATNSTGGILGKMVSLQSIVIGTSAVNLSGREGEVLRRLLPYSLVLVLALGILATVQVRLFR